MMQKRLFQHHQWWVKVVREYVSILLVIGSVFSGMIMGTFADSPNMKPTGVTPTPMPTSMVMPTATATKVPTAISTPNGSGLMGFSATQDQTTHAENFVSHGQGSRIANIPIYGWGSLWPFLETPQTDESDSGQTIDARIHRAVNDGQEVMLTCATAPSIYRQSDTPWKMDERVMESKEDQYALRCAQAVQRWPQITRVQVWNELKGYWLGPENRWDYESYTRFYNKVYIAIKGIIKNSNRAVLVGGGYAPLSDDGYADYNHSYNSVVNGVAKSVVIDSRYMDAMQYWIKNARGYDAICLDGKLTPKDFVTITHWFRQFNKPIWWAEFYSGANGDDIPQMHEARKAIKADQQTGDVVLWWSEFPW